MVASSQNPQNTNLSLSADSNKVILTTAGTLSGKNIVGVLFNVLENSISSTTTLSVFPGTSLTVSRSYNGSTVALYADDRSTTTFTVVTGGGGLQTITTPWGLSHRGPEELRKGSLNG